MIICRLISTSLSRHSFSATTACKALIKKFPRLQGAISLGDD
jgi:hypothetical protein